MDEAKITNISDLKNSIGTFETNAKTLMEEKQLLNHRVNKLTNVNEELKIKFSGLLDQFQLYVTAEETKKATDDAEQKQE